MYSKLISSLFHIHMNNLWIESYDKPPLNVFYSGCNNIIIGGVADLDK